MTRKRKKVGAYLPKIVKKTLFAWKQNGKTICYEDPKNPQMLICKEIPEDYLWLDTTL